MLALLLLNSCKKKEEDRLPVIITSVVDIVTPVSAICKANVALNGGSALSERGVCWSTGHLPVITDNKISGGTDAGEFAIIITGLAEQTGYYARAFATNRTGTVYGGELNFTTPEDHTGETGTVEDADSNTYHTIGIGSQYWTTENMKTTSFNDGTPLSLVTDNSAWNAQAAPGYCWYDNNEADNKETFGALYNWYTVISSKFCPAGWHVPSDADWTILETFLGGPDVAGGKTKEAGTSHWTSPNTGATNECGLSGLPGGTRTKEGAFVSIGESGVFWSSTDASNLTAWSRTMDHMNDSLSRSNKNISWGCSVRCVKD